MAIKRIRHEWCAEVGDYRCEFIMDSADDVNNLPSCCAGSTAIVADASGEVYMVNASGEWKPM